MIEVNFHDIGTINDNLYTRVIVVSRYNEKWVYSRHKERATWEIPGGHIEKGEDWLRAAKRELYEETGAIRARIEPICVYSISSYGLLCYAEIEEFGPMPKYEIEEIQLFDREPSNLTYPETHSKFLRKVMQVKNIR